MIGAAAALTLCCAAHGADVAWTHARIYVSPDSAAIADGTILVHDGLIAAIGSTGAVNVPTEVKTIDLHQGIVVAGFWNSHVHLMTPPLLNATQRSDSELSRELTQMLTRWGFTTVFDTASLLTNTNLVRARIAAGQVAGPTILTRHH
jgi:cytosine/adenosine deaminase-related metal-dependent hydrolase